MKRLIPVFIVALIALAMSQSSCIHYGFRDTAPLPDSIKTVKVDFIENRAPYRNPQLSPSLTERIRQKIVNQTKLSQTNNDNAHYLISGYISDYSVITSGVSSGNGQSQTSVNRLTVTVKITLTKQLENLPPEEFTVSRSFDFKASLSLQQAESQLLDDMVKNLTDEIFNHIFSSW